MKLLDLVVDPEGVPVYQPKNHTGTLNRSLIGRHRQGAGFDLILGEIQPGGEAEWHSHTEQEQGIYILSGSCRVEIGGDSAEVPAGRAVYFPRGLSHRVVPLGGCSLRLLVIYSPSSA